MQKSSNTVRSLLATVALATASTGALAQNFMTDKAAVEIPAPVTGRVVAITGQPGDMVAVGSELIAFDTAGDAPAAPAGPARAPALAPAAAASLTSACTLSTSLCGRLAGRK